MEDYRPLPPRNGPARRVLAIVATTILGGAFLISAGGKAGGAEAFGWTIYDWAGTSEPTAQSLAWFIVAAEALVGAAILLRVGLRRWALPAAVLMLLLFSAYLGLTLYREGNNGDCGCFGEWLEMSPAWALAKNAGLLLLCIPGCCGHRAVPKMRRVTAVIGMFLLSGAMVLTPYLISMRPKAPRRINLSPLYSTDAVPMAPPGLEKGRHVVLFLSSSCGHCRAAAAQLGRWEAARPGLPVYFTLLADSADAVDFLVETNTARIPHSRMADNTVFKSMAGKFVPAILFLQDGVSLREVSYRRLTQQAIYTWAGGRADARR